MTTSLARSTLRAFLFVLFTPLLLGIVVVLELNAYQESIEWVAHTKLILATMDHLLLSVTRAESAQRAYLLSGDGGYMEWFSKAKGESDGCLRDLQHLTADNANQQRNLALLSDAVEKRFGMMQGLITKRRDEGYSAADLGGFLQEGSGMMREIWNLTHLVNAEEHSLLEVRVRTERSTKIGVAVSFVVCILVNLGVLIWAYRLIVEYARAQESAAEQITRLNTELESRVSERTLELQLVNEQLTRSNDDLTKFAYIASHDLQEPLRTIGSYVGLLSHRYQGKLDEQADRYIKFAVDGAKRMQNLVQDLLLYSRVGTEALKVSNVNMESVLQHVRESFELLIREQHVVLSSGPLPTLIGDESKLTQVFLNLIGNAVKFKRPDREPQIHVKAKREGSEWLFAIQDNGIGFDQQYADRIFAIFQRLHGVGVYPGTGMGLAICKRIIESHGGRIWATSNTDVGSSFCFTLPVVLPTKTSLQEHS